MQVFAELQNDFFPNFILCTTTQRFIRSARSCQQPVRRPTPPNADPGFLCGTPVQIPKHWTCLTRVMHGEIECTGVFLNTMLDYQSLVLDYSKYYAQLVCDLLNYCVCVGGWWIRIWMWPMVMWEICIAIFLGYPTCLQLWNCLDHDLSHGLFVPFLTSSLKRCGVMSTQDPYCMYMWRPVLHYLLYKCGRQKNGLCLF